jgi:hypothetical protein
MLRSMLCNQETGRWRFQAFEAYVQHRQEQTAQVHSVREGDGDNSAEEQDHSYRHGPEYWEAVD